MQRKSSISGASIEIGNAKQSRIWRLSLIASTLFLTLSTSLWWKATTMADEGGSDPMPRREKCKNRHWFRDTKDDNSTPAGTLVVTTYAEWASDWSDTTTSIVNSYCFASDTETLDPSYCESDIEEIPLISYRPYTISPLGYTNTNTHTKSIANIFMKWSCPDTSPVNTTLKWSAWLNQSCTSIGDPTPNTVWGLRWAFASKSSTGTANADSTIIFTTSAGTGGYTSNGSADITQSYKGSGMTWSVGFPPTVSVSGTFDDDNSWNQTVTPTGVAYASQTFMSGTTGKAWATATMLTDALFSWSHDKGNPFTAKAIAGLDPAGQTSAGGGSAFGTFSIVVDTGGL